MTVPALETFPFDQVSEWLLTGQMVVFVGSGASRAGPTSGDPLPDGAGLANELVAKMGGAFPAGDNTLARVAQYYEHTVFDRPALYSFLHERLELGAPHSASVADLLAGAPMRAWPLFIITTNYDSIIERAFRIANRPLCVATQNLRNPGDTPPRVAVLTPAGETRWEDSSLLQWNRREYPNDTTFLLKMHGSTTEPKPENSDNVIITEDDYVDFFVNSGGAVSPHFPPSSLHAEYRERRFLFLGYSLYDWNFRAFLRMLSLRNALSGRASLRHWAVQWEPDSYEVETWKSRNVNIFHGDLVDFCARIKRQWP